MSGGYLEGFKKIYSGKNVLKSHLFLFALFVGLSIPSVIATLNVNSTNKEQLYNYIYIQHPDLGIVTILFSLLLNLYCVHFIHKALKFQIWKDTEQNEERIKAFPIMPDINFNFFKPLGKCILFWIIWLIYASIAPGIIILLFAVPYGPAIVHKFISFTVIIYALFLGILTVFFRFVFPMEEGVFISILLMNLWVPFFDRLGSSSRIAILKVGIPLIIGGIIVCLMSCYIATLYI